MDANNISSGIGLCHGLLHLGITSSHLNCYHIKVISSVLIDHPSLTSLNFSHNKIGDYGFKYFGKILSPLSCHFVSIDLSDNLIGADGAILFSLGLERNNSHNKIGDYGFKYFGKILSPLSCHFVSIDLSDNLIGADGAILFSLDSVIPLLLRFKDCKAEFLDKALKICSHPSSPNLLSFKFRKTRELFLSRPSEKRIAPSAPIKLSERSIETKWQLSGDNILPKYLNP